MKADAEELLELLRTTVRLEVPIFQRNYSWTENQCQQLWDDVRTIGKSDPGKNLFHFLGTVVMVEEGEGIRKRHQVIDGQQRLTSVTLLLCALAEAIGTTGSDSENRVTLKISQEDEGEILTGAYVRDSYIVNSIESGEHYRKMHLAPDDDRFLQNIIGSKDSPGPTSEPADSDQYPVWRNFGFFRNKIKKCTTLDVIWSGLTKLRVIVARLQRTVDNPQLIFESMNSTGLGLAETDLIRNYILMNLDSQEQTNMYSKYWKPLEAIFSKRQRRGKLDSFMRHYLTLKQGEIPRRNDVYDTFKDYAMDQGDRQSMLNDILRYATYYSNMEFHEEADVDLRRAFQDITELKVDVAYPFLLKLYDDYGNGDLAKEDFISIIRLIESYVFRRVVCQTPSGSMNNTFASFGQGVDSLMHQNVPYLESVKVQFYRLGSYRAFPKDAEFKRAIGTHNMYHIRSRRYWLHRFENHGHDARVDISDLSIEHIMPQNKELPVEWQQALGEDWRSIHEENVHRIGNLTLIRLENNAKLSDNPFRLKCKVKGGLGDSTIKISKDICEYEEWNRKAINDRSCRMAREAVSIWPYPSPLPETLDKYKTHGDQRPEYSIENHSIMQNEELKALFVPLREELMRLDGVEEIFLKAQVKYLSELVLLRVYPRLQAKGAALLLNLPVSVSDINDPRKLCLGGTFPNGQHYTAIWYRKSADAHYIVNNIVEQVLDIQRSASDGE